MDLGDLPTLNDLEHQGLLTPQQSLEMEMWFQASSRARVPLELPLSLWVALRNAALLHSLKPGVTVH
jgi:hypothetical protein